MRSKKMEASSPLELEELVRFYDSVLRFLIRNGLGTVTLPLSKRGIPTTPISFMDAYGGNYFSLVDDVAAKLSVLQKEGNCAPFFEPIKDRASLAAFVDAEAASIASAVFDATGKVMTLSPSEPLEAPPLVDLAAATALAPQPRGCCARAGEPHRSRS